MWHSAPALNRCSDLLFAAAALIVLYGLVRFAIHQPVFAMHELRVVGVPGQNVANITLQQVETIAQRDFRGTFFTVDIERLRTAFEKLPWVRRADVRRQWPDGIEVFIEEHVALARWGDSALVNTQGEVFAASSDATLPLFAGPNSASVEITQQYEVFRRALAAIGRKPVEVRLSARRAWQLRLDNGMTLEIGREQVAARLSRFLQVYPDTIVPLGQRADYVDLRYANGFAVRVPELAQAKDAAPRVARPGA